MLIIAETNYLNDSWVGVGKSGHKQYSPHIDFMVHFSLLLIIAWTNKLAYNKEKTNWLLSNLSLGEHKNGPQKYTGGEQKCTQKQPSLQSCT